MAAMVRAPEADIVPAFLRLNLGQQRLDSPRCRRSKQCFDRSYSEIIGGYAFGSSRQQPLSYLLNDSVSVFGRIGLKGNRSRGGVPGSFQTDSGTAGYTQKSGASDGSLPDRSEDR